MESFDLIVVGGGPGGYATAAAAASRGTRVALIERDRLGGTCLNRGCIPTKVICHGAEAGLPYADIRRRISEVIPALREGVETILRDVTIYHGNALFTPSPHVIAIEGPDMTQVCADKVVIATGSTPASLPIPGAELCLNSDSLLELAELPESMAIIGGGVIGMEFASALNSLGVKVTVIEYCPEILPGIDAEIAKRLRMALRRRGVDFHTGAAVTAVAPSGYDMMRVSFEAKGKEKSLDAAKVLMAVGRRPIVPQGTAEAGIELTPRGFIAVDNDFTTSVPGIYAIGDVNGQCMLAHAAEAQGRHILGIPVNLDAIPAVCFTSPAVASVGPTASRLREMGYEVTETTATFRANGYAMAIGETDGMVKLVTAPDGTILSCHICGPHAADLIAEAALAVSCRLTAAQLAATVHAHPTLAEALALAASSAAAN
ncbi:MAG: FAD-dependent oxidoreductase [Pseudoflavonifractor sp.]|nr:FAD-dependent oxidoreductase [Alloprevotella sp.]MCM1116314.1 FAD-dependent oxidoreductase [Pseudoflavonifractor sp.]